MDLSSRPINRQRAVSCRPLMCLCYTYTAMHRKLDARGNKDHIFSLLLASDHTKLRPSVEPMTINGQFCCMLLKPTRSISFVLRA